MSSVPGETNQNSKNTKLITDKITDILVKIIDILVIFVKKKKNVPKNGGKSHQPDLSTSCSLLTLTLIPGINVIAKINKENNDESCLKKFGLI